MKKLLILLKTFEHQELLEFAHFLDHPSLDKIYSGQVPSTSVRTRFKQIVLGGILSGGFPPNEEIWWEQIWKHLFPNKVFDRRKLTQWCSPFVQLVMAFFEMKARLKEDRNSRVYLYEELHRRKLISWIQLDEKQKGEMANDKKQYLTENDINDLYRRALLSFNLAIAQLKVQGDHLRLDKLILGAIGNSWQLLVLRHLRWKAVLLNQNRFDTASLIPTLENLLSALNSRHNDNRLENAYQFVIDTFENKGNKEENWQQLVDLLCSPEFPIRSFEGMELLRFALNIGVRLANEEAIPGARTKKLFALYRFGFEQSALEFEGSIPSHHYHNLCFYALQVDQIDFAIRITHTLEDQLDLQGLKEKARFLNQTMIEMADKRWGKAWLAIQQYDPQDIRKMRKYVLEVKILFEHDQELMHHRINSFLMYLRKEALEFDGARIQLEKRRLLLIKKLSETGLYDRRRQQRLWESIQTLGIDQSWLIEKFVARFGKWE